jgi:TPR repeat protein
MQAEDLARARPLAFKGVAFAQRQLGEIYLSGSGVPKDLVEGAAWLRLAEAAGDAWARETLARYQSELTPAQVEQSRARAAELRGKVASPAPAK